MQAFWIGLGVGLGIAFVILSIVQLPRIRAGSEDTWPMVVKVVWGLTAILLAFSVGSWFLGFLCIGLPDVAAKIGWPPTIALALIGIVILGVVHRIVWGKDG
jgi:hypothetical protein